MILVAVSQTGEYRSEQIISGTSGSATMGGKVGLGVTVVGVCEARERGSAVR